MLRMHDFEGRLARALADRELNRTTHEDAKAAAVLIPIVAVPEPTLIFTVRTDSVGSHKGQISFPGGRLDPGETPAEAALRETEEEIGLDPAEVTLIGELDTFPTYVSGYVVTPFVGWLKEEPELTINPAEVAELLHVPIAELRDEIREDPGFQHRAQNYPTEAWIWEGRVIWGVTARIVRQFLTILGDAGLAEPPGGDADFWNFPPPKPA